MHGIVALIASTAAIAIAAPALALEELPRGLARLGPETVARAVRMTDDPAQRITVMSTADAWSQGHALQGAYATDVHLKAVVDRVTRKARWQVWHELEYQGAERRFSGVTYLLGANKIETPLTSVEQWTDYSVDGDGFGRDARRARVVFELPEDVVRLIAAGYRAGSREPWRLQFREAGGGDVSAGLAPAEVAGLVLAFERWQARGS
ncbi:hypothetical protein [Novosphingobium cyanobacteriorum]|uniref:Uncharacterized protein n=1 Tax=Novosphingobium cyanobacteriorum TaxID=3024215 RepID=A0ABT6CCP3_9SPHN|nr:hypothetical protein [Novosphingobium cyanobacteriorum]MDF8331706.1 hypothetical protein [Novosphingobium cyanobacteriorum]